MNTQYGKLGRNVGRPCGLLEILHETHWNTGPSGIRTQDRPVMSRML